MIVQIARVSLLTKNKMYKNFLRANSKAEPIHNFVQEYVFFLEKWKENLYNTVLGRAMARVN